ncbi:MAG: phosphatase PAP2 family protein [Candidatus Nanopelagicales bacterium]
MTGRLAPIRGLLALTAAGVIGVVGLYVIFVRVPIGQRWDDRALLGGQLASLEARQAVTSALHGIRISTIILMVVVLLLAVGLVRKQRAVALVTVVAFGGAIASAEILKRVLPRRDLAPELNAYVDNGNIDTYPSGHSAIAMAFALGVLIVTAPRYRTPVAGIGMLWVAAVTMATLAAGWHRPSDILGGVAVALAWMAAAAAMTVARRTPVDSPSSPGRPLVLAAAVVFLVCAAALAIWIWLGDRSQVPVGGGFIAFLLSEVTIALVAVTTVGLYAVALERSRPPR